MFKHYLRPLLVVVVSSLASLNTSGQSFKDPIESKGTIPNSFFETTSEKFTKSWEKFQLNSDKADQSVLDDQEYFFLQAHYGIEQVKTSGQVFLNDDVGRYLQKIVNRLVELDPDLDDTLQVYLMKSPMVNAFASDLGSIFVTTGLFSRLHSEAEIAFVLCHELNHYKHEHNIQGATNRAKIRLEYDSYGRLEEAVELTRIHGYSRKLEIDADSLGMELYLKSGYSLSAIQKVFDILATAEYTSSDRVFDEDTLAPYFVAGENLWLEEVKEIEIDEDSDDDNSTHPNIASRRAFVNRATKELSDSGRKEFIVGREDDFNVLTDRCRYFNTNLLLRERLNEAAFYEAYLLFLDHPDDADLLQLMGRALYGKVLEENHNLGQRSLSWRKVKGEAQQVYHVFQRSSSKQLSKVAGLFNYQLYLKYGNPYNLKMAQYSMDEMYSKTELKSKDLMNDSTGMDVRRRRIPKSKRDEYDGKKYVYDTTFDQNAIVWSELAKDSVFNVLMDNAISRKDSLDNRPSAFGLGLLLFSTDENISDARKAYFGNRPDIDSIVIVDPWYMKADNQKEVVLYQKAESRERSLINTFSSLSKQLGMTTTVLDVKSNDGTDAELLDDIYYLKQIVNQYMGENYSSEVQLLPDPKIDNIVNKYGSPYFMWTGIIAAKQGLQGFSWGCSSTCCVAAFPQTLPFSLFTVMRTNYTYGFHVIVDLESGKLIKRNAFEVMEPDNEAFINLYYYDALNQIHEQE